MKKLALIMLLVPCVPVLSIAQNSYIEQLLTAKVTNFLDSVTYAEVHDRFWDDDLIYTSSSGLRFGKKTIMEGFMADDENEDDAPSTNYSAKEIQINVYDDMAVFAFKLVGTTTEKGQTTIAHYLNTGTFKSRNGDWKVVAWQATKMPEN